MTDTNQTGLIASALTAQNTEAEFAPNATGAPQASCLKSTTCPYCGVGCGVDVALAPGGESGKQKLLSVSGTPDHLANFGRLCVKGSKLLESNGLAGRLLAPQVNGQNVPWQQAFNTVADKFAQVIRDHGPDAVAFYVSGQLLTEDYYVANKLMKGYIGSANIDTNSRLCMSSAVAAYKRAFGADAVPCCYEDLEHTELLVMIGSNAAWTHPVLFQRMERAKKLNPRMKVVFIDPRKTASCELADLHLPIKPGSDVALFNGLLHYLATHNGLDQQYIADHTDGLNHSLEACQSWDPATVADYCDINITAVRAFYQSFAAANTVVSFYSMGVNQSTRGVDKANAIINCHLATGTIGKVGCGPFSITGQPNAMGGREVGGLANMLAAHMDIDNPQHRQRVQDYWQSPTIPTQSGLKAVDLFEQIEQGNVKAVWIMATNPMVSMPDRNKIEAALAKCEMVVVSDCVATNDTIKMADVVLPATTWSEKNGTVTNSERRISRQRGLLAPAGQARHDWQIICEVAKAMGFEKGFNFSHPSEIFCEHAGLSGKDNSGERDFDISALSHLSQGQYDSLLPVQWPVNQANPQGRKRLFTDGKFFTPNGKARFIALEVHAPQQKTSPAYPFVLNSGRIRDQWHSMTRTGTTAELTSHISKATLSLHPLDAEALGVENDDLLGLNSIVSQHKQAQVILPVKIDRGQRRGEVFAPIHWSQSNASSANITCLFTDANDAISGQAELKHGAVSLHKVDFMYYGVLAVAQDCAEQFANREQLSQAFDYWHKTPIAGGQLITFAVGPVRADQAETPQIEFALGDWLQATVGRPFQWLTSQTATSHNSFAVEGKKMILAVFSGQHRVDINPQWLSALFAQNALSPEQQSGLLRAQPDLKFNQGRLICSCFKVSETAILAAIAKGCKSVDELGDSLQCGTNCGSCKPELSQLLHQQRDGAQESASSAVFAQTYPHLITLEPV
ncbi:MAG: assimilatory nitrate reductase catalytic subunit [Paraglaciecola sp.]|jgi:assimilatory nitrate reductase catalytic subunit